MAGLILWCGACAGRANVGDTPTTQPADRAILTTTQPSFWLDQPETASARGDDFERLWSAAEHVARDFYFRLDRQDYRAGLLTTQPMISAQWFEPWRREVRTLDDRAESSLATIRRTVRFEFERIDDGGWRVTPKVLVERESLAEQRITSAVGYRQVFRRSARPELRQRGTRESDVGIYLPYRYWYPIGRDEELERALARAIAKKVTRKRDAHSS